MRALDRVAEQLRRFDLLEAPGHLLRRNHQRSTEIFAQMVGGDVTRQQIALLIALNQNPGAAQHVLVAATDIDKSTLKEMLGRMVTRGWVERDRDPDDQRAWRMNITAAGLIELGERLDNVVAAQTAILAPLPEAMRPVFLHCLRVLVGLETARASDAAAIPRPP
jgi:DNA-binding MarR family transcriptional regulator